MHACSFYYLTLLMQCTQKSEAAYHVRLASGANGKGGNGAYVWVFSVGGRGLGY